MKTKKKLNALKEEVKSVNEEMRMLTDEELAQVSGGLAPGIDNEPAEWCPAVSSPHADHRN